MAAQVIGWLVLLLVLAISIGVHELGHMVPAKLFGVRVPRYMIGFGPTLWSTRRGETEYGIKAIPLGGYTKLVGMIPPADVVGARPGTGAIAQLVQDAREASAEEIEPGEDHRAFYRLSTPKKVVVMAGGILANLLMAVVLFAVVFSGIGTRATSLTLVEVPECVYPADAGADFECSPGDPQSPGSAADIRPGDRLVSFDGQAIEEWSDFTVAVQGSEGSDLPLVVERDGAELTLLVSPVEVERPVFDDDGNAVADDDGEIMTAPTRYIGVQPGWELQREPLSAVGPVVWEAVTGTGGAILNLPMNLVDVGRSLVSGEERSGEVIGLVGMGQVAGQIAAADGPSVTIAAQAANMLVLAASLNMALFMFNLLPLVPLDGGHVVGALWEGAKRQWARLRGLPRPAPADTARMMPLAYGVFVIFGLMTVFLVVADLVRPVTL